MMLHRSCRRRGVAATEMALLAPFLLLLLMGIWEVGRCIMVQNLLDNAAREGARISASGSFFSSTNHSAVGGGTITLLPPSTNGDSEVQKKVLAYLQASGVTTTGATVTVANVGSSTAAKTWSYTYNQSGSTSGGGFDPAVCADQLDRLNVTVSLPYQNVSWSPVGWFISSSATITARASWASVNDLPLNISTTIPSKPIQPTDPLP